LFQERCEWLTNKRSHKGHSCEKPIIYPAILPYDSITVLDIASHGMYSMHEGDVLNNTPNRSFYSFGPMLGGLPAKTQKINSIPALRKQG
jgi:hypothetical protein